MKGSLPVEPSPELIFRARQAYVPGPHGAAVLRPVTLVIAKGRILRVIEDDDAPVSGSGHARVVRIASDRVLLPGFVDCDVHLCEPGHSDREGIATGTRAALSGGVTTVVDQPSHCRPETTNVTALARKIEAAAPQAHCDLACWAAVVPDNLGTGDLRRLWEYGVLGFVAALSERGEAGCPPLNADELLAAMVEIAEFDGLLVVHAEDPEVLAVAHEEVEARGGIDHHYATFLRAHPATAERLAVRRVLAGAQQTGCRVLFQRLADDGSVELVRRARRAGHRVRTGTTPHHLTFAAEEILDGGTHLACRPPIRDAAVREGLWRGLADGVLDFVATDHLPWLVEEKHFAWAADAAGHAGPTNALQGAQRLSSAGVGSLGSFGAARAGISSAQLFLPALWSAARARGIGLGEVVRWGAFAPARAVGFTDRGAIAAGHRADLVEFAPNESFVVIPEELHHRVPVTAYAERALAGVVHRTWLSGVEAYHDGHTGVPNGRILTRPGA